MDPSQAKMDTDGGVRDDLDAVGLGSYEHELRMAEQLRLLGSSCPTAATAGSGATRPTHRVQRKKPVDVSWQPMRLPRNLVDVQLVLSADHPGNRTWAVRQLAFEAGQRGPVGIRGRSARADFCRCYGACANEPVARVKPAAASVRSGSGQGRGRGLVGRKATVIEMVENPNADMLVEATRFKVEYG